ncbi:hypothetical protein BDZ97DRAFT_1789102 [Flammula alnicola]|nr:hypothetical protein BDZ97DRAFT_1789102 [Flammula alnicola]
MPRDFVEAWNATLPQTGFLMDGSAESKVQRSARILFAPTFRSPHERDLAFLTTCTAAPI